MGASTFLTRHFCEGASSKLEVAFQHARQNAILAHGTEGYTGSIADKEEVLATHAPPGVDPYDHARALLEDDSVYNDKWGPAGAIRLIDGWLFFGWAAE